MTLVLIGGGFMLCMILIVILLAFIAFPVLKKVVGVLVVGLILFWVVAYTITEEQKKHEATAATQTYRPNYSQADRPVITDITDRALLFREHDVRSQPEPIPLPRPRPNRQ